MSATSLYHNLSKLGRVQLPSGTSYALIDYNGRELIAPIFNTSTAYAQGDYVVYQDELYCFTAAHSAGSWNANQVTKTDVSNELKVLKEAISGGIHYIGVTQTVIYDGCTNPEIITTGVVSAQTGDLVILDVTNPDLSTDLTSATYPISITKNAYYRRTAVVTDYYIANATNGTVPSWDEAQSLLDWICSSNKGNSRLEFIWDGTQWNALGSAVAYGDLAFKDSASGSYTAPTGSGSVTVNDYSKSTSKLVTTTITGVNGTESVSKMTAGTAVDVAKAGTAVRYGTADVGEAVTYGTANKAASATTVGNANVGTEVVAGTADAGTAVTVATAGSEVVYGTADVGTAVTYGNANVGTAVTGIAKVGTSKTFTTAGITASVSDDCLTFAAAGTASVIGIADTTGVSITPAASSNTTLTPAVAAPSTQKLTPVGGTTSITPAVTATRKIAPAVASLTTIYGAVDSTSTLTPAVAAPNNQTVIPAVANGTITPWTESSKTVAKAASSATTVATGGVDANGSGSSVVTDVTASASAKTVTVGTTSATVTVK